MEKRKRGRPRVIPLMDWQEHLRNYRRQYMQAYRRKQGLVKFPFISRPKARKRRG